MKIDYKAVDQLKFKRLVDKFQTITTTVSISENFVSVTNTQGEYYEEELSPNKSIQFLEKLAQLDIFDIPLQIEGDLAHLSPPKSLSHINYEYNGETFSIGKIPDNPNGMAELYQAFDALLSKDFEDFNNYEDLYQANLYGHLSSIRVFSEGGRNIDLDLELNKYVSINPQATDVTQEHELPNELALDSFLSALDLLDFYQWPVIDSPMNHSYKITPHIRYMIKEFTFYTYGDTEHPEKLIKFHQAINDLIHGE